MLYYTAKVLGKLDRLKFREKLLSTIFKLQAGNGGFYTRYVWGEHGPEPLPGATTNTETTSLVIIALTYTPESLKARQSWPTWLHIAILTTVTFIVSILTVKRLVGQV